MALSPPPGTSAQIGAQIDPEEIVTLRLAEPFFGMVLVNPESDLGAIAIGVNAGTLQRTTTLFTDDLGNPDSDYWLSDPDDRTLNAAFNFSYRMIGFQVSWGDGTVSNFARNDMDGDSAVHHEYAVAGTYSVTAVADTGEIRRITTGVGA